MPKTAWATDPETTASTMPGTSSRRTAAGPARRKTSQSNSSPDRRKIIASAPCLILDFHEAGSGAVSQETGTFATATPASSMPSSGCRPVKEIRAPPACAESQTTRTDHTLPPGSIVAPKRR